MNKQTKNRLARIARQCDGRVPEVASKRKESARAAIGDFWREKEKARTEGKVTRRGKKKPKASRQFKGGQKSHYQLFLDRLKTK